MNDSVRRIRDFFVSIKLTVVLLSFSILLVFAATLAQVDLGIWAVQQQFFHSFVAVWHLGPLYIPLPGGYLVGGLLLINLISAHAYRFKFTLRKSGIQMTHIGLILLLIGELLSGLWQEDYSMRLTEGETKNYSESYRDNELAITDVTDANFEDVVVVPEPVVAKRETIQHPKLPFRVTVKNYFPNSAARPRAQVENPPPPLAANGDLAQRFVITPQPITYKPDDRNVPTAVVELTGAEGPIGSWVVTTLIPVIRTVEGRQGIAYDAPTPQRFEHGGRTWTIALRSTRAYKPFSLTLLKFSHDVYVGTDIPKNFSSRIKLNTPDGADDREVLIYMNNPFRYAGLTFYQASFERGNDKVTILQVVRNPSWLIPYVACALMSVGLLWQFGIHLFGFLGKRRSAATAAV